MLRRNSTRLFVTAIVAASASAFLMGCGGDDEGDNGGGTGGGGTVGPCPECTKPPPAPAGAPGGDGAGTTLGVSRFLIGDADRSGSPSQDAWKQFGYDLDDVVSNPNSTEHCQPVAGANATGVKTDGAGGIDNSFGANIVPIVLNLKADAGPRMTETITEGSWTVIIQIDGLGAGTEYADLAASMFAGAKLEGGPSWNGSDQWPVYCELMEGCSETGTPQIADGNKSTVQFTNSYVTGGTWVSGTPRQLDLTFAVAGFDFKLAIRRAVISMKLGDGASSATEGVLAGVLETEELVRSLQQVAGRISSTLCDGPSFQSVADQVRQASDIMSDGTQDPSQECNGISVGLGFDMSALQVGPVNDKSEPGEDPCNPVQ